MHIYGARTFGLSLDVLAVASVVGALTDLRVDAAILFIAPRYRALRLAAGSIGIVLPWHRSWNTSLRSGCSMPVAAARRADQRRLRVLSAGIPRLVLSQTLLAVYRAWLYRRSAFALSSAGQLVRAAVFSGWRSGSALMWPRERLELAGAILFAQVGGDGGAPGAVPRPHRPARQRQLMAPWPPRRAIAEIRANWNFIVTASFTNLDLPGQPQHPAVDGRLGVRAAGGRLVRRSPAHRRHTGAVRAQHAERRLQPADPREAGRGKPILPDVPSADRPAAGASSRRCSSRWAGWRAPAISACSAPTGREPVRRWR